MQNAPYPPQEGPAHAVAWIHVRRWTAVVVFGLLLVPVSASAARAPAAIPPHVTAASPDAVPTAAAVAAHTTQRTEVPDLQPVPRSGYRCPTDSSDVWLEESEDDDSSSEKGVVSGTVHSRVEETLGLRRPSRTSGDALTPDGRIAATQFLTDAVRRM